MKQKIVYLDNGATSWPKPPSVGQAMVDFLENKGGNPGRGGHFLAREAVAVIEEARCALAKMINAPDSKRVVLTHSCTDSLNLGIHGVIRAFNRQFANENGECPRPHIITTSIEHNAVLRTLHCYKTNRQIDLDIVPCDDEGLVHVEKVVACARPDTLLFAISHSSNVLGTIQPAKEIVKQLRQVSPEVLVLLDAAQTIGHIPIDVQDLDIDLLSIAGHKALRGPTGTGAIYIGQRAFPDVGDKARIFCERRGGTGAVAPGLEMPNVLPDALEAGTPNAVGFAGLLAAVNSFSGDQQHQAHEHEMELTQRLIDGLLATDRVTVYGRRDTIDRTPVVLFNIEGLHPRKVAAHLDANHGIATRGGVHCAPMLHETIGTSPDGGVRVSPGVYTTDEEIDLFLSAIRELVASGATISNGV
ncbi:MAG: aminotransferase class V-fold PLP-dependent enzyme [Pirellulaceae bacterium]